MIEFNISDEDLEERAEDMEVIVYEEGELFFI